MKSNRSFWVFVGITVIALQIAYLATRPRAPQTPSFPTPVPTPTLAQMTKDGTDPYASFAPYDNGFGVLVCDPVIDEKSKSALGSEAPKLGAGCARWLHLILSDHGELGQTPSWTQVGRALYVRKLRDWQIDADDAKAVALPAQALGVTHIVTGRLAGDAKNLTLTWQVLETPGGKAVGNPITLSGTPGEIVAALPGSAKSLLKELNVSLPRVPQIVAATPDELALCGTVPMNLWIPVDAKLAPRLEQLGRRFPLAGLLAARHPAVQRRLARPLMEVAGDSLTVNAYLLQQEQMQATQNYSKYAPLLAKFPQNYQVLLVQKHNMGSWANAEQKRRITENGVRAAPLNTAAWVALSNAIADQANEVRQARTIGDMSAKESETVMQLYPLEQAAAEHATKLDDRNGYAWYQLCIAAAFNGDLKTADQAFWQAELFHPEMATVYGWGLEMYQEKWGGTSAALLKVAKLAAKDDDRVPLLSGSLSGALSTLNQSDPEVQKLWIRLFTVAGTSSKGWLWQQPLRRARLTAAWQNARKKPNDAQAWQKLSTLSSDIAGAIRRGVGYGDLTGSEKSALGVFYGMWFYSAQHLTQLEPKSGTAWANLAKASTYSGGVGSSAATNPYTAFDKAIALSPQDPKIYQWGLNMYQPKWGGDEGRLWQLVQKVVNNPVLFDTLATEVVKALENMQQPSAEQQALLQKAMSHIPVMEKHTKDLEAQKRLELFWTGHQDYARARRAAAVAVKLAPLDANAHFRYGGTMQNSLRTNNSKAALDGAVEGAITEYRRALQLDPEHAEAASFLGDLLAWRQQYAEAEKAYGQAAKAQPYWGEVVLKWGQMLDRIGKKEQAQDAYARVLELGDPDTPSSSLSMRARAMMQASLSPRQPRIQTRTRAGTRSRVQQSGAQQGTRPTGAQPTPRPKRVN